MERFIVEGMLYIDSTVRRTGMELGTFDTLEDAASYVANYGCIVEGETLTVRKEWTNA